MQKEPGRRNHRPSKKEVSAGARGLLCCHVEKMKAYVFAQQQVIRPICATGLDVFSQKIFVLMRLLLVSGRNSDDHRHETNTDPRRQGTIR